MIMICMCVIVSMLIRLQMARKVQMKKLESTVERKANSSKARSTATTNNTTDQTTR